MKRIIRLIFAVLLLGNAACSSEDSETDWEKETGCAVLNVYFIDVGHGDAILIDYCTVEILIDGGKKTNALAVAGHLQQSVDGSLEIVIATHPDEDHIGGLIDELTGFPINELWLNGRENSTKTYAAFTNLTENLENAGTSVVYPKASEERRIGKLVVDILNPPADEWSNSNDQNFSIVFKLTFQGVSLLFTGDIYHAAEKRIMESGANVAAQILKVAHHGSTYASSEEFLEAVAPKVAIISEDQEIFTQDMRKWSAVTIYQTALNGTTTVTVSGGSYEIQTEK